MNARRCWWHDCVKLATGECGVCDAWFCDAHSDHGPYGDAGHGEDPENYRRRTGRL